MSEIETVRIKSGDSFAVINQSDYDAERHELFDDESRQKFVDKRTAKERAADERQRDVDERESQLRQVNANRGVASGRKWTPGVDDVA